MHIGILGPLEVRDASGNLHSPGGPKQRLLLAALLLHSPRATSTDQLVDILWTDGLPADPRAALRTHLSRLRGFLRRVSGDSGALQGEPHGYRLSPESFSLDADRFRELFRQARAAGDPAGELALLDEALRLWRGAPYEEFADHRAFLGPARSLAELRVGALERRIECLLEVGHLAEALSDVESLVEDDPLRERPHALLMTALWRAGRAHEALSAFQQYRLRLADELGLDPSPGLRQLERSILRQDSPPAPPEGIPTPQGGSEPESGPRQAVRFCRAPGGVRLAYATVGRGPPLVKAANWLNHIEFDWESPVWRGFFRELAAHRTLVRYDERACGLSDWDVPEISLEAWVLDLETIVDACGLERFPLLGISQGCAVCIEYAARHPERVSGLILHGGYAAGWRADPTYDPAEVARRDASIEIVRHGWGEDTPAYRQMFTLTFIPEGTVEQVDWFNELERRTVSPENAVRFMEAFAQIDVRDRLPEVQAPTLVLHARGDQRIHYRKGMELAEGIPDARFVMLESRNHLLLEREPAFREWMTEAKRFLEGR